jgi:ubiquinone/menaquinone biosynthesis C-methylase UbiE
MKELKFTGERLVTSGDVHYRNLEHLHRYALALEYVENKIVLDIASGEGYGTNLLSKKAKMVYGVDISEEAINHAQEKYDRNNIEFKVGSVINIPFEENKFDVVVSFETIEHLTEQEQMLSEIKRVLKKDGILILSSPDREIYASRSVGNIYHLKELTLKELLDLLKVQFKNIYVFKQLIAIGSLIIPTEHNVSRFKTYDGTYYSVKENLKEHDFFNKPFFNILICGNIDIDRQTYAISSLFSCYECYNNEIQEAYRTITSLQNKLNQINAQPIIKILKKTQKLFRWRKFSQS